MNEPRKDIRTLFKEEIPNGLPALYGCMVKGVFVAFPLQTDPRVVADFLSTFEAEEATEGIMWTDESQFMPLSDINCNHLTGFFQVSVFPDEPWEFDPAPPLPPTR